MARSDRSCSMATRISSTGCLSMTSSHRESRDLVVGENLAERGRVGARRTQFTQRWVIVRRGGDYQRVALLVGKARRGPLSAIASIDDQLLLFGGDAGQSERVAPDGNLDRSIGACRPVSNRCDHGPKAIGIEQVDGEPTSQLHDALGVVRHVVVGEPHHVSHVEGEQFHCVTSRFLIATSVSKKSSAYGYQFNVVPSRSRFSVGFHFSMPRFDLPPVRGTSNCT